MPRERSWTDEMLVEAVAESRTMKQVFARLGIRPGRYEYLREHIARLGLDASHIPAAGAASPNARLSWTDTQLARSAAGSATSRAAASTAC
jgi:hypothetical protein